ncbi:MAG: LysR family transcriptional regulator [Paraglaciecola sp.]|nr:LysR family transcriptional regulator [Paraglaciecola sp.]
MINPIWLRTFSTLVAEGHFTRTAERLHMTQSGVSQHIHKLEEFFNTPLLIREGKQFYLSDAGERLHGEAKALLVSMAKIEQLVAADPAFEGLVRIKSPGSIGLKLYKHLLALQQQHPKLVIDYRFAPNREIEHSLSTNTIDLGFMTALPTSAEVVSQALTSEPLLLVTPAEIEQVSWAVLATLGFINHPDGAHHANQLLKNNFAEFNHIDEVKQSGFSNQISLILEPVSLGLGFTVLPAYAVDAFHQAHLIKSFRLPKPASETIYLCSPRRKVMPERVKTVKNAALRCL